MAIYIVHTDASSRYRASSRRIQKKKSRKLHPSSIGAVIKSGTEVVGTISKRVGFQDSNYAEFLAMHAACRQLLEMGVKDVHFYADCFNLVLLINQNIISTKVPLRKLSYSILSMLNQFDSYKVTIIPRRENKEAHQQARLAFRAV